MARKDTSAERSVRDRDSTESCVSSLCLDLPSSVPPSNCSKASANSFASPPPPPPRGGLGHAAAAAATARGNRARGAGSSGNRSSIGSSSAAESDSPWSLRALSSADLSPVSPRQTPEFSPAAVTGITAAATAVGAPPPATRDDAAAASADGSRVAVERTLATLSAGNRSVAGCGDSSDGADGREGGGDEHPRPAERPCAPPASWNTRRAATKNWDGKASSGVQAERALHASRETAPRPESLKAARPELPWAGEEDGETADGLEAEAGKPPRGAAESRSLLRSGGDARQIGGGRQGGGEKSLGAGPASLATGDSEHVEHTGAVLSSGPGAASGSGSPQGRLKSGATGATSTPPDADTNDAIGSTPATSSAARELAGTTVATPGRTTGDRAGAGTGSGGSSSSSSEKPCFTNGAPLTNWAAGVCGRGELLSYPGEEQTLQKPPAPAPPSATATTSAAAGGDKALTETIGAGAGDPVSAGVLPREEETAGEDSPGTAASAGLVRRRQNGVDGGPPGRSAGEEAQGPKWATSSTSAHQLTFTSEEESCGNDASGDAGDSAVTDPSPGRLFSTPPPAATAARVGVRCEADDRGRSTKAERAAPPRGAGMASTSGAAGTGAGAPAAKVAGKSGRISDRRRRVEGSLSSAVSPPRSPVPALSAVADRAAGPLSPLVPSPDATQTPGRDAARAIISTASELARPAGGTTKRPPPATDSGRPPVSRLPTPNKGKARDKAEESRATTAAGANVPDDPLPAAAPAVTSVPARPSAGGWFSSRRVEGFDNSPLTACSEASLGGGGTATQSPDLLAHPAGLGGATTVAARARAAGRGDSSRRRAPPCRPAEACRASGAGERSVPGAMARSTTAGPTRCDGGSSDRKAFAPRGGDGVRGGGDDSAGAAGTSPAAAVVAEEDRGRRNEARGEKRTRIGGGGIGRTAEHAQSRGLAGGGETAPGRGMARKVVFRWLSHFSPLALRATFFFFFAGQVVQTEFIARGDASCT